MFFHVGYTSIYYPCLGPKHGRWCWEDTPHSLLHEVWYWLHTKLLSRHWSHIFSFALVTHVLRFGVGFPIQHCSLYYNCLNLSIRASPSWPPWPPWSPPLLPLLLPPALFVLFVLTMFGEALPLMSISVTETGIILPTLDLDLSSCRCLSAVVGNKCEITYMNLGFKHLILWLV